MKAKEKEEKHLIKIRYAAGFEKALKESKYRSYRELASQIGFEPSHIQRISAGKVDVVLSTSVAIAEGLNISYAQFSEYYDTVTQEDIDKFVKDLEARKTGSTKKHSKKNKSKKKL